MTVNPGKALDGLRVLDVTQVMAGPFCAMQLCDMGADVIKVEPPEGDSTRRMSGARGSDSPSFNAVNRGKRGVVLNLKAPSARDALRKLARRSDVLIENFRPGVMKNFGLDYESMAADNPGLVYASISGYGQTGPYAAKGGFDLVAQGVSGLMSITGEPGGAPVKTGNSVADINAGILAVTGILAAWAHKLTTGQGQVVDTSLMEAALQQTYWHAAIAFATGVSPGPTGSAHILTAPYQAFRAQDGWINVGGANQANWERIAEVLGHPEWRDDARFRTNSDRMANLDALVALMDRVLATGTRAHWIAAFDAAGVPVGPVNTMNEALADPQALARGMIVDLVHPQAGATKALGCPVHFSATPTAVTRPAPMLGEHTREVLAQAGYSDADIEAFVAEGVVAAA